MTKKFPLLLFHFTFYQKLFLDEFSDIDMKLVQNQEVPTCMCSTKIDVFLNFVPKLESLLEQRYRPSLEFY